MRMMLQLATAATATVAFVQPFRQTSITRHDAKRNDPLLAQEKNDLECRIDEVLTKRSQELLDELGDEQTAREAILSSRLPGLNFLDRSEVRPSRIFGAGRGLFAIEDVPCGEVITCYPGDALLASGDGTKSLLWGEHVPDGMIWDDEAVFAGTESAPPLTSYSVSVDDRYSVLGHPSLDDDPAYYGHYANDGMDGLGSGIDEELGVEKSIDVYMSKSAMMANAMHRPFRGTPPLHMVTVATKNIKAGEEIFVTYGPDYWGIPAYFEEAMFRKQIGALLNTSSVLITFLLSYWLYSLSSK